MGSHTLPPMIVMGVQGSGKLVLSPTTLDLGAVGVGSSTTASFTVSNAGNLPLTITKAKAPSGTFSTTNPLNEGLVITDNTYYQPVTFTPPTLGPFTSQYLITGDDGRGPQIVTLTGTGVAPGTVFAVSPTRLLDTRGGPPVSGGHVVSVAVLGRGGVPTAGVAAVVLNVTVTLGTSSGNVAVYAHGGPVPGTSNLNFVRGQTVPNLVLAPVGNDGKVDLLVRSTGSVHLIADLSGYVVSGAPTPGGVGTVAPMRVLDTRGGSPVSGGHVVSVSVLGRGGVPSSGVAAVVLNVTVTLPTSSGNVAVYADGRPVPGTSNLNFVRGQTVPNLVLAPVGADGKVDFLVRSTGSVHVIADVFGYTRSS